MGVLLYIKFAACIFSEQISLRTPLDGCFWCRLFSTLSSGFEKDQFHVVENKWSKKFSQFFAEGFKRLKLIFDRKGGQAGLRGGCLKKGGGLEPPYKLWMI